jgi:hypothetical protein
MKTYIDAWLSDVFKAQHVKNVFYLVILTHTDNSFFISGRTFVIFTMQKIS